MEENYVETKIKPRYIHVPGAYDPGNGRLHVCMGDFKYYSLVKESRARVRELFNEAGKPEIYEDFFLVMLLSHEAAHFVQHVRGELGVRMKAPEKFSSNQSLRIFDENCKNRSSKATKRLIQDILDKVFESMDYHGGYPPGVFLRDGFIPMPIIEPVGGLELEEYYRIRKYQIDVEAGIHAMPGAYIFEDDAVKVLNDVLSWWLEREELPFSFQIQYGFKPYN